MKFFITIIVLSSLLITAEAATCSFCEGGITVEETYEIPGTGGLTCGPVAFAASTLEEGTDDCSLFQVGESFCCPASSEVISPIGNSSSGYSPSLASGSVALFVAIAIAVAAAH